MVRRQGKDMVFDDTALRQVLDYRPRPFEPGRADFQIPENLLKNALSRRQISAKTGPFARTNT
jgi:hypothetical protein